MKLKINWHHVIRTSVMAALFLTTAVGALPRQRAQADEAAQPAAPTISTSVYLPALFYNYPWDSPFGVESFRPMTTGSTMLNRTIDLSAGWVRMGTQISWRLLQPDENLTNAQILANMDATLGSFENELRSLRSAGITPLVTIKDSPYWAVENVWLDNDSGVLLPTSCGPIRSDKFAAFANFVRLVVDRYSRAEFNVHNWELGNEPDVDPNDVPRDFLFGCWGEKSDQQYYGGDHFGEMLKVVSPVIRSEDPSARIWLGGLLLSNPNSPEGYGKPENFLRGVLAVGGAPHFDILPYHWHPSYYPENDPETQTVTETLKIDFDLNYHNWVSWGGGVVGKARYLRQMLNEYGVSKQLVLNETGFGCADDNASVFWCSPPSSMFFNLQADLLVRMAVRGMSENLDGYMWYTITGPGWRNSGLLNIAQQPRPSYNAYQALTQQLKFGNYLGPINYRAEVEAYEFRRQLDRVHVAWAKAELTPNQTYTIQVPADKFKFAYDINGAPFTPPLVGSNYEIAVGFSPVYIVRNP